MKRTFFIYGALWIAAQLMGQSIPNGNFETWKTDSLYPMPDVGNISFVSSNDEIYWRYKTLNVTKVAGAQGSAIRIETKECTRSNGSKDTSEAYYVLGGEPDNNMIFPGGFPFSDSAVQAFEMYARYHIDASSPGIVLIQFKKNGIPVGENIGGTGLYVFSVSGIQNSFTKFTFPIFPRLTDIPDTVAIGYASNNVLQDPKVLVPGDFIEIDSVYFTGTSQKIPGGGFNAWKTLAPVKIPAVWNIDPDHTRPAEFNFTAQNPLDSSTAVRITKKQNGTDNGYRQRLELGQSYYNEIQQKQYILPGIKLNAVPRALFFSFKYTSTTSDSASVQVALTKWDATGDSNIVVGGFWGKSEPTNKWKKVFIPIEKWHPSYVPDSAYIKFEAGDWKIQNASSELLIDNVYFHFCEDTIAITGEKEVCLDKKNGITYSVPSIDSSTYQWILPAGATIVGKADSNVITVNFGDSAGVIRVIQSYADGCANDTAEIKVSFKKCTSSTGMSGSKIDIYPNPAPMNGVIHFTGQVESVEISDLTGKVMMEKNLRAAELSLENLPAGIYLLRMQTKENISVRKLLIK